MQFLSTLGGIAIFIIIIGLIIAVHEFGHFFFARRAGILAREFALGMGPILWKKKKGETLYTIRAIPIGGFCAIAGEEMEDDPFKSQPRVKLDVRDGVIHNFYLDVDNEGLDFPVYDIMEYDLYDEAGTGNLYMEVIKDGNRYHFKVKEDAFVYLPKMEYQIAPYNRTLGSKSKRARALVMFGGPLMNFILAIIVFLFAGLIQGFPVMESSEVIITENVVAYDAGLRTGDVITKLETEDGIISQDVSVWNDISIFMSEYKTTGNRSPIIVNYLRNDQEFETKISPWVALNNLAIETAIHSEGLKVIRYVKANDGMVNNEAMSDFFNPEKGDLIITKFIYNDNEVDAKNLVEVYSLFESYKGDSRNAADNEITLHLSTFEGEKVVKVMPYSKKIMDYQTKQNGIEIVKVAMHISPRSKFNIGKSFVFSITESVKSGTAVFSTLGMLFSGDISIRALSGFVGIASATVKVARQGLVNILYWTGLLSVNIGLLNLLPIPALDGGRLVFLGYEAITKKKPSQKVETWLITATMLLLFGLMIFVTINDFLKFF
jgi:regulator of sigma E protease